MGFRKKPKGLYESVSQYNSLESPQSISESPLEFEITRVNCIIKYIGKINYIYSTSGKCRKINPIQGTSGISCIDVMKYIDTALVSQYSNLYFSSIIE